MQTRTPVATFSTAQAADKIEQRPSWRSRFRALLCCLAPPVNDNYYRTEPETTVIRPPQPPTPPPLTGEAVLGPLSGAALASQTELGSASACRGVLKTAVSAEDSQAPAGKPLPRICRPLLGLQ